jgi:hypothetical protein
MTSASDRTARHTPGSQFRVSPLEGAHLTRAQPELSRQEYVIHKPDGVLKPPIAKSGRNRVAMLE